MKTIYHAANTRGHADHGWLKSFHSFSFANYHDPKRMNFGALRVLNDDVVAPGRGFGTHPHRNMEIISIPLEGDLQHMDDMGNSTVIKQGDIQVMSAGSGVSHSEFNKNKDQVVKFLQIWVFPNQSEVTPRYDQITVADNAKTNGLTQIVSPNPSDEGVWIHQDAWFYLGNFTLETSATYSLKNTNNGVYLFILDGELEVNGQLLHTRDGYGIWGTDSFNYKTSNKAKILFMEVPMKF
ncbi:pirin family protein [Maribacter sp. LLG6340-A2]|uniref:pirin family protein n=1 Tax=Maribacter sp. LLG6340-A2 TaxID=3160834 RepID=UPI00386E0CBB